MPMLIPNPKAISKNIENISKSGINIDDIVRHSINCDIRNILKNDPSNCISTLNRLRSPLKETSLTSVTSTSLRNQRNVMKSSIQKVLVNQANYCDKYQRKEMKYCDHFKKENMGKDEEAFDDSLTSLQWLTGVNVDDILEGKPIQYTPPSPAPSSSSEDGDDKRCFRKDLRYYSDGSVDYRKNHEIKPPYSYAALIIMAMKSKLCGKMTLSEIYKWISDNFIFYRNAEPTWQNSIRHNLSLNKCFTKIPRKKGDPGKGGYWSIVPEFANKLLENSIRKRRSAGYQYCSSSMVKRQRLDMLETQLLSKIKAEMKDDYSEDEKLITKTFLDQISFSERSNDRTPVEILADLEHCRMDHPYGKSPVVNYNVSDEENIRAIASHLQESTSNMDIALQSGQENITIPSNSSMFNSFASAIRTDCIWSSEQSDSMSETMRNVTDELLEARNISSGDNVLLKTLSNSLNSTHSLASSLFCLSPPISGDDDGFSDELDDMDDPRAPFSDDDINLTIHGTSIKLFKPTPEMIETANKCIKEEPLSPDSIDLEG